MSATTIGGLPWRPVRHAYDSLTHASMNMHVVVAMTECPDSTIEDVLDMIGSIRKTLDQARSEFVAARGVEIT